MFLNRQGAIERQGVTGAAVIPVRRHDLKLTQSF
jgi:hypothetical protein